MQYLPECQPSVPKWIIEADDTGFNKYLISCIWVGVEHIYFGFGYLASFALPLNKSLIVGGLM